MICMKVVVRVHSEKMVEFLNAMSSLKKDRLLEQGISGSQLYSFKEDATRFILIDEWETDEDLQRYFRKESYRILLGALRTLCVDAEVIYDPLRREGGDSTKLYKLEPV